MYNIITGNIAYLTNKSEYIRQSLGKIVEAMRAEQKVREVDDDSMVGALFRHFPVLTAEERGYSPCHNGDQCAQYYDRQQFTHACKSNGPLSVVRLHEQRVGVVLEQKGFMNLAYRFMQKYSKMYF